MAAELNQLFFDPMLVKPKCVWVLVDYFQIVNKQVKIKKKKTNYRLLNWNTFWASPTYGQKCSISVLQPFAFDKWQL